MQFLRLKLENLRSIGQLDIDLTAAPNTPRRRVVLLGANGSGKTTLLDALAHVFQTFAGDEEFGAKLLQAGDVRNVRPSRLDVEEPARRALIELQACLSPEELRGIAPFYPSAPASGRLQVEIGGELLGGISQLDVRTSDAGTTFEDAVHAALVEARPPCVLLPARRGVLTPRMDVRVEEVVDFNPRRGCLSREQHRFDVLSIRLAMAFAGDKRIDPAGNLKRMWKVLEKYFPELPRPVGLEGMSLQFENRERALVPLSALSDGERALLLMFSEVALRAPSHGIVLIDEVEQHLHPRWQRMVAEAFAALVPTAQFFLTTQSPYLAASVPDDVIEVGDWKRYGE
jgi:energy-coupling factor transporter ATP-binding protein EcfA2